MLIKVLSLVSVDILLKNAMPHPQLPAYAHFNIALPITNLEGLMGFHGCFGKPVNRDISNFDPREARFKLEAEKRVRTQHIILLTDNSSIRKKFTI